MRKVQKICTLCKGSGIYLKSPYFLLGVEHPDLCPACQGKGYVLEVKHPSLTDIIDSKSFLKGKGLI